MSTRQVHLFGTAPECRAKAASLRTMSTFVQTPELKAKMLGMAMEWESRAEAFEAGP